MQLKNRAEICGILDSFEQTEDDLKLKFTVTKMIEIPIRSVSQKELQELLGERIGVIHIDDIYLVRKILRK